ncbi:MAG: thiopurine S-methyltransferase [Pseudomonadota bacterium]
MDAAFWHERWRTGRTAFHQEAGNPLFRAHFPELAPPEGGRVFLPLSGKAGEIPWLLGHGYRVAAAELDLSAVEQLFRGLGVTPTSRDVGALRHFAADGIDVYQGDVFDLTSDMLGSVDLAYDRAALVALPLEVRARYAAHIRALIGGRRQMLVTFEYDQSMADGPPFSVGAPEVMRHYGSAYRIVRVEARAARLPGVSDVTEVLWSLTPRS